MKLGLVEVTDKVLAEVGLFFVSKKDGTRRMIVDARPANALFARPPHTHLYVPERFSQPSRVLTRARVISVR
jgi:hypothetical protein